MEINKEYKKLVKHILDEGIEQDCRNGSQLIIPHYSFTLDHINGDNHELTLRKMYYKGVKGEFKTLIDPTSLTNVKQFEENGCNYWKLWAEEDGSINIDYHNMMHPQLEDIIRQIKYEPNSRRHVIELWDHNHVYHKYDNDVYDPLSLPCCWHGLTFSVIDNTLHLKWIQRSVDTMIGLPADIYLSYLFMSHIAHLCDLKIGTCMYSLSNVHIYSEHIEGAKEILRRSVKDKDNPLKFELKE